MYSSPFGYRTTPTRTQQSPYKGSHSVHPSVSTPDRYYNQMPSSPGRSPKRTISTSDFENIANSPSYTKPATPKSPILQFPSQRQPCQIPEFRVLRAISVNNINDEFPSRIIDINSDENYLFPLGNELYTYKDGRADLFVTSRTPISSVAWFDQTHALFSSDGFVELWDVARHQSVQRFQSHRSRCAAIACNGSTLVATGGDDGIFHQYDVRQPNPFMTVNPDNTEICSLTYHPDGMTLAYGSNASFGFYSRTSRFPGKISQVNAAVQGLVWANESLLVAGERIVDGTLRFINMFSNSEQTINTGSAIISLGRTPYGLLVGHEDERGTVNILSPQMECLKTHETGAPILNLAVSPSGTRFAALSDQNCTMFELTCQSGQSFQQRFTPTTSTPTKTTPTRNVPLSSPGRSTTPSNKYFSIR